MELEPRLRRERDQEELGAPVQTMMKLELQTKTELGAPVKRETVTTRVTEEIDNDGCDNEPESIELQEESPQSID
jgi:hypothetical protein